MSNFRVGQPVVCIDDMTNTTNTKLPEITAGQVYVIRRIGRINVPEIDFCDVEDSLWLEGIDRFITLSVHVTVDLGFRMSRFRPVVERKTDISIFTNMLHTQRTRVPV